MLWLGKAIFYLGLVVSHNDQFPGMDLMFLQQAFLQGLYEKLEAFIRGSGISGPTLRSSGPRSLEIKESDPSGILDALPFSHESLANLFMAVS